MKAPELLNVEAFRDLVRDVVREVLAEQRRAESKRDEYLKLADAARIAGVSERTIRRCLDTGKLTAHGRGRIRRVRRAELDRLLGPTVADNELSPEQMAERDFGRWPFDHNVGHCSQ